MFSIGRRAVPTRHTAAAVRVGSPQASMVTLESLLQRSATRPRPIDAIPALLTVVFAHVVAVWALLQIEAVRQTVGEVAPTLVQFIVAPVAPKADTRPPVPSRAPLPGPNAPRPIIAPRPALPPPAGHGALLPAPAPEAPAVEPAHLPAMTTAAAAAAPAPPIAPSSPVAHPARVVPASAIQYLVQPPIDVPLASRRMGEHGTVWLRVRVGRDGLPQQITLQTSSGFDRLDRQALDAMREARFKPQSEGGQPIEWIVTAPLQYDIE